MDSVECSASRVLTGGVDAARSAGLETGATHALAHIAAESRLRILYFWFAIERKRAIS